ncbi:MAG: AI-2E family transporter [Gammaproteobacteria bacterium]|jgi:predicted PurR-regulated permease PerM
MSDTQKGLLLAGIVAAAVLLYLLAPVLTPFLVGAGLAYLGDPLADWLEARRLSRTMAVVIVFGVMLLLLVVVVAVLLPLLQQQILVFAAKLPGYLDWVQHHALPWLQTRLGMVEPGLDMESIKQTLISHWQQLGGVGAQVVGAITRSWLAMLAWLANLVLIPLVTFYLLRDWDTSLQRIAELLPRRIAPIVTRLAKDCDTVLGHFLRGQLSVMLALAVVYCLGLWWVGIQLALLIGLFAGMVSFVPYLGFILGVLAAGIAALVQFHDAWHVLQVFLVFGVGQLLESFVLTPLLLGERIGLHPLGVIFAIMVGGQLFGFVGVLLALPTAAVIGVLLRYAHERYIHSQLYAGQDS